MTKLLYSYNAISLSGHFYTWPEKKSLRVHLQGFAKTFSCISRSSSADVITITFQFIITLCIITKQLVSRPCVKILFSSNSLIIWVSKVIHWKQQLRKQVHHKVDLVVVPELSVIYIAVHVELTDSKNDLDPLSYKLTWRTEWL